ncbi:unnamed protein product, partial [Mesorhabditis belari]|uniref:Uncharacterized protein n=1 Tax=Mesorhabditis belari TaxID=2138241 RepID=A0AAF3F4H5_9BILA
MIKALNLIENLKIRSFPPEDPSEISRNEAVLRKIFGAFYRFIWAVFVSWQVNDFLYSPLWMHGYVWCLNLPVDTNMAEISAGPLVLQQLRACPELERIGHDALKVIAVAMLLFCTGFYTRVQTVRRLWKLSCAVGFVLFLVRSLQMEHRLFPSLHEAFCSQTAIFLIGLILTIHTKNHVKPKTSAESAAIQQVNLIGENLC